MLAVTARDGQGEGMADRPHSNGLPGQRDELGNRVGIVAWVLQRQRAQELVACGGRVGRGDEGGAGGCEEQAEAGQW